MNRKQSSLTVVYYNQTYGFIIVPYAIERNMRCRIAIEPTIKLLTTTSENELGKAVKEGIKIAVNALKTDIEKNNVNEFWKRTKYKSFRGFSNHFQSINIDEYEDILRIEKWISTPSKGYVKNDSQKPIEIPSTITNSELGTIIKNILE